MAVRYRGNRRCFTNSTSLKINLDQDDLVKIRTFCEARGWTLSHFLRTLALKYIAKEEARKP